jgi:hypothetical protein
VKKELKKCWFVNECEERSGADSPKWNCVWWNFEIEQLRILASSLWNVDNVRNELFAEGGQGYRPYPCGWLDSGYLLLRPVLS